MRRLLAPVIVAAALMIPTPALATTVTVQGNCDGTWTMTNNEPDTYRAYIIESNDNKTTVISAGPGETTAPWPGDYDTYTATIWFYDGATFFTSVDVVAQAPACETQETTTTTTVPPTTTTTVAPPTTVASTTTTVADTTTTTEPEEEILQVLPYTGLEGDIAVLAGFLVAFGGGLWKLADYQSRKLRRKNRRWRTQ